MLIYILLFLYLVFMFWLVNARKIKNEGWLLFSTFIVLFIIAGFRHYSVGSDAISYKAIFENNAILPPLSEYFDSRFELGFLYLNHVIYNYITTNYSIYFAIYSFITLAITFFVIKKESKDAYLSLIIYATFGIYTWTMSNIRGSLAMAFVYLAYYFINRNKHVKAVVSLIIASSFHLSSLIFLLVYFFRKVRIRKNGMIITIISSIIGYFAARIIMGSVLIFFVKYQSIWDIDSFNDRGKVSVILGFLTTLIIFIFGEYVFKGIKLTEKENFLRNIMIIACVVSFVCIQTSMLGRFTAYFNNFIIIYIPLIISKIKKNDFVEMKKKQLIVLSIIILFNIRFFVMIIVRPDWNVIVPYRSTLIELLSSF